MHERPIAQRNRGFGGTNFVQYNLEKQVWDGGAEAVHF